MVSLQKIDDYSIGDFSSKMDELISPIFDLSSLGRKRVLLKPNLLIPEPPEKAVTTHPIIVEYFIRKLKNIGAEVVVGDSPAIHSARNVAKKCGILMVCEKYGVPLVNFDEEEEFSIREKIHQNRVYLTNEIKKADFIINLARVKTHGQMTLTLAVKNLFGCVVGIKKARWHIEAGKNHDKFAKIILSISRIVNGDLHILDGIVGMEGNGPRNGTPKKMGFIAASKNPYALDLTIAKILGYSIKEVPTIRNAVKLKFPGSTWEELEFPLLVPEDIIIENFKRARPQHLGFGIPPFLKNLLEKHLTPHPEVVEDRCKNCKLCLEICQSDTIAELENSVKIELKGCIHCFCCQEVCPHAAIVVKEPLLLKLINTLK